MNDRQKSIDWLAAVLEHLAALDADSTDYIKTHRVSIRFRKQGAHTSAIWTPGNRIYLNPTYFSIETKPGDAQMMSILIHEVRHLQQGFFTALSVYGEQEAWQLGFRVYHELTGFPYHPDLVEFMTLPLGWDRNILRRAQVLMQVYASKRYRSDLLPLYPLGREIKYRLGLRSGRSLTGSPPVSDRS